MDNILIYFKYYLLENKCISITRRITQNSSIRLYQLMFLWYSKKKVAKHTIIEGTTDKVSYKADVLLVIEKKKKVL